MVYYSITFNGKLSYFFSTSSEKNGSFSRSVGKKEYSWNLGYHCRRTALSKGKSSGLPKSCNKDNECLGNTAKKLFRTEEKGNGKQK